MTPPTRVSTVARLLLAGAGIAASGCEAFFGPRVFQVRDSSGIAVAESSGPEWGEADGWQVASVPALEIGRGAGGLSGELHQITGAARLGDGRIVVAEAANREVRYYDSDGALASVLGGLSGDTPPFHALSSIARLPGDSVLIFDAEGPGFVVLGPAGEVASRTLVSWEGEAPLARAWPLSDGRVVVQTGWSTSLAAQESGSGVVRAPVWFLLFGRDGALLDTVAALPGDGVASVALGPARTYLPALLGPLTVSDVQGSLLYAGTGEKFEIALYDADGGLQRLVRVPGADLSISPEELTAAQEARGSIGRGNPIAERLMAQIERALPDPTSRPAYGGLVVDELGNLWVGEYPWLGASTGSRTPPRLWTVFDPEGRLLGQLELPEGLEVLEVGEAYVLGVRSDRSGQTVLLFELTR